MGQASPRPGRRELVADAVHATRLTWRAARAPLLVGLLVASAGAAAPVVTAWLTKAALDGLVSGASTGVLVGLAAGLAVTGVVAAILPQIEQYVRQSIGRRASVLAAGELYGAVNGLAGLRRFEDPRFLDRLRLADDGKRAPGEVVDAGLGVGRAALALSGFVGSLAVLSPAMTAVVLVAAIPTLVAELALSRRRATTLWEIGPAERRELFYSQLLTSARAAKEIRLFGSGGLLRARMIGERRTADAVRRRMDRRELGAQGGLALLGASVAGGGLVWTIHAARHGRLSVGDISMFIVAVAGTQSALAGLITHVAAGHQRLLVFDHHRAVVRSGQDLPVPARPRPVPPLRRGIELRDVWFRYSEAHPWVLQSVTLHVPAGAAVALVGRNGAGKSTAIKLLCRFYDPTRGAILWDGVDIREMDPQRLRDRIAAVFQDYMEYDLTAAENIGLGEPTMMGDLVRVEAAARRAGVHDDLAELPHGYDTLLSRVFFSEADRADPETGVVLSGGQWQRLALARAFMRDQRDLMILDEPSAGLDAQAEHDIHTLLRQHRTGRTSLLISHRLSAVRDADRIVVLDGGALVEQGSHADLMAKDGTYARLFRLQAAGYAEGFDADAGRLLESAGGAP